MSKHRADVRPRWGRIGVSLAACAVLVVALLATAGILHSRSGRPVDTASDVTSGLTSGAASDLSRAALRTGPRPASGPTSASVPRTLTTDRSPSAASTQPAVDADTSLPAGSGSGRRAVFSLSRQRVWIVGADGAVERTYLVSGSVTDNLHPGTYSVYSRSANAIGVDDSGTMRWFVRFAHGANAAIGFHDIPVKDGRPLQTAAQLGTPQSHGCIRQKEPDALAMWAFARLGTTVVVTA